MLTEKPLETKILFRFWGSDATYPTTANPRRLALWRVFYDGRYEYHVMSARGVTIVEAFSADTALYYARATKDGWRKLHEAEVAGEIPGVYTLAAAL